MKKIKLSDQCGLHRTRAGVMQSYAGEIEFEYRDRNGNVLSSHREPNIIKIFAKEILAHRIPYSKVWDPTAASGAGAWVTHDIDIDEFAVKYIVLGASFDEDHNPLDAADARYYIEDSVSGGSIPITLGVGAEYDGGLINAIPIAEPYRPLKRIERIYFEHKYQPAGTPLLQDDVRAINNVVVFETTLQNDEYNGFGITSSDYFTLTEVALCGGAELDSVGSCECDPRDLFLTGDTDNNPFGVTLSGAETISLDSSVDDLDAISEGDQIKIVDAASTAADDSIINQLNPYYLVLSKSLGGHDIVLDRTPVDNDNVPLTGAAGVFRDGFKVFSHRVLKVPHRKSGDVVLVIRWRIIYN